MTFVAAFILMSLLVAGMSIGVILSNRPIKGSCGGLNAVGLDGDCKICGRKPDTCEWDKNTSEKRFSQKKFLAKDVMAEKK